MEFTKLNEIETQNKYKILSKIENHTNARLSVDANAAVDDNGKSAFILIFQSGGHIEKKMKSILGHFTSHSVSLENMNHKEFQDRIENI